MPLLDNYGRAHDDLRISVTDRCNFRCFYCMPEEGMSFLPHEEILSYEEVARVVRLTTELGFTSYHLTGGEPLLRKDIDQLIRQMLEIQPGMDLALTTNGVYLPEMAERLYEAGLRRVNISLDTLDENKFLLMTRRNLLDQVLKGIEAAAAAGFSPIKINAVAIKNLTEAELPEFAKWARETGHIVRFIEYMPLDADKGWEREKVLTAEEILKGLSSEGELEITSGHPSDPATRYRYKDGKGEVGVIASVTRPFCEACNRLRLTAEGEIRTCLFSAEEHSIKALLRGGSSDDEIKKWLAEVVRTKTPGHLIGQKEFVQPSRTMSSIGG
ncbi:MAG: GTP 3',8-cyclase MoaA [Nitrospinaceae bacterium]|mgnify:CR=1 FL=1|jgi:GTP 3',8-cyclase|nr:GTP 3',8-cyclase MoaA [Nitrospinaceae bacterium]MBT3433422.1 GTP 3',8-cyclase MoaA [Nitrospinaceae bacterium]MBT4092529.1 GTP 3',8-cyclase MoaA [Nitrospinaceae bacterium]MBT4431452.1 GTP 3',8-cyclase MoaA [Nitrospinaceae bacterium]MBT5947190.1 GTP 3',8-cyclase MoaA [Nitrospinaceae bacterium]